MDLWLLRCRHPLRGKWLAHDEPWPGEAPVALALDPFRPMPAGELAPTGAKITGVSRPTLQSLHRHERTQPGPVERICTRISFVPCESPGPAV